MEPRHPSGFPSLDRQKLDGHVCPNMLQAAIVKNCSREVVARPTQPELYLHGSIIRYIQRQLPCRRKQLLEVLPDRKGRVLQPQVRSCIAIQVFAGHAEACGYIRAGLAQPVCQDRHRVGRHSTSGCHRPQRSPWHMAGAGTATMSMHTWCNKPPRC